MGEVRIGRMPVIGIGRTATVYDGGDGTVLKVFEEWFGEEAARTELAVGLALNGRTAGAPFCHGLELVDGRLAIRYEKIEGHPLAADLARGPLAGWTVGRLMARSHAQVLACGAEDLATVRQRLAWAIGAQTALSAPERAAVEAALAALPDGEALCHGDFHCLNLLCSAGQVRVIDWMNAALGRAAADVARSLVIMRWARDVSRPSGWLERRVVDLVLGNLARQYLRQWLAAAAASRAARRALRREVEAWLLPQAAARLSEDPPPGERRALLRYVRRRLRQEGRR